MLRIRLARIGKKGHPAYKVVIAEKRRAVKKEYLEVVGSYNPSLNPVLIKVDKTRIEYWTSKGAKPTETVERLLKKA